MIKRSMLAGITAAAVASGIGAWTHDVVTCPGEVKGSSGPESAPILYCDENPEENNIINNPGTVEQKLSYGSFLVGGLGLVSLSIYRRKEENINSQTIPPESIHAA